MTNGSGGGDPGAVRHRILRLLRHELERHPAVQEASGEPDGEFAQLIATVDPSQFGRDAETATLELTWYPLLESAEGESGLPETGGRLTDVSAMFRLHYSEPGGYDCGFHHEPNRHVDGWLHFQDRGTPDSEYEYAPCDLEARSPVAALWELLDILSGRIGDENDWEYVESESPIRTGPSLSIVVSL